MEVYILLDILRDKKPLNFAVYIGSAFIKIVKKQGIRIGNIYHNTGSQIIIYLKYLVHVKKLDLL